jgi:hypothetical protein
MTAATTEAPPAAEPLPPTPRPSRRTDRLIAAVIAGVAFVLRAVTAGHFQTGDEFTWLIRSATFSRAVLHGDFGTASATHGQLTTMPGVTTMWLGTITRVLWRGGDDVGLWDASGSFVGSPRALHIAQLGVAATCALLVFATVVLASRWAGRTVAVTAGTLVATEPFLVAHGAVFHTDELAALFSLAGLLALLPLLDLPHAPEDARPDSRARVRLAVVSGLLFGGGVLTKVSAFELAPGCALLVAWATWRQVREHDRRAGWFGAVRRDVVLPVGVVLGVLAATVFALWPALWIAPGYQFSQLVKSAKLGSTEHLTFFRGHITGTPGPIFYFVALPFRMTPWFLIATPIATAFALAARRQRERAIYLLVVLVPMLVILARASKQFDRYGIGVLPLLALLVGLGVDEVVRWARDRRISSRATAAVASVVVAAVALYSFDVAPWGLAYFNPLLGGGARAQKTLLVGWGEGLEKFGRVIARRERGHCDDIYVVPPNAYYPIAINCGHLIALRERSDPNYVITYISGSQRLSPQRKAALAATVRRMRHLATLNVRGIHYGDLYERR